MTYSHQHVQLSRIDVEDTTFRISILSDIENLVDSIKQFGLINPPVLIPAGGNLIIISGFRRIRACRMLGLDSIEARILPVNLERLKCVQLAIIDNASQRQLNPVELSRALKLLSEAIEDTASFITMANALGISVNQDLVKKLQLIVCMPDKLQDAIVRGSIALPLAIRLYYIADANTVQALTDFFDELNLNLNRQREMLDWIEAITFREKIAVIKLLNETKLLDIKSNSELDRRVRIEAIRHYFRKRRYPSISMAEKNYENNIKQIPIPKGSQLIHPHNFESQTYTLKFDFKTSDDLMRFQNELRNLIDSPQLEKVISFF